MVKQLVTVSQTPNKGEEMEMVVFTECADILPLLLVVGARGPKVVMMDGRLAKKRDRRCEQSDST